MSAISEPYGVAEIRKYREEGRYEIFVAAPHLPESPGLGQGPVGYSGAWLCEGETPEEWYRHGDRWMEQEYGLRRVGPWEKNENPSLMEDWLYRAPLECVELVA